MSSWTDKKAVEITLKLRDEFKIKEFIETGTYTGVNAKFYSDKFEKVKSCEKVEEKLTQALERLNGINNVCLYHNSSPFFLKNFIRNYKKMDREDIVFIYLDAHFYDPRLPLKDRFAIKKELKALEGFKNCIIAIHDFDNGELGHIIYDNIHLDLKLIKKDLMKVNPEFKLYTNNKCDIVTPEEIKKGKIPLLDWNEEMESTMKFVWSNPIKTYRGILYAIPKELNLKKYDLRKHD